jgi:hypothetical protein
MNNSITSWEGMRSRNEWSQPKIFVPNPNGMNLQYVNKGDEVKHGRNYLITSNFCILLTDVREPTDDDDDGTQDS